MKHPFKEEEKLARKVVKYRKPKETSDADAIKANIAHNFVTQRGTEWVSAAILCGEVLCAAKKRVGHSKWIRWIDANLNFTRMTANRYIRMYEHKEEILAVGPPSLRAAIRLLSDTNRITPGLLSADYKILVRNLVSPIRVVRKRLNKLPNDPLHYDDVTTVLTLLKLEVEDLLEELNKS